MSKNKTLSAAKSAKNDEFYMSVRSDALTFRTVCVKHARDASHNVLGEV